MKHIVKAWAKHYGVITIVFAFLVTAVVLLGLKISRPVESDTVFFAAIAKNWVQTHQYSNPRSPWPDAPALDRLPGWTSLIALGMTLFPSLPTPVVVRGLTGLLNVLGAWLVARLAAKASGSDVAGLIAGIGYAVYLPALNMTDSGLSETGLIVFLTAAALTLLEGRLLLGSALLGLCCLFRGNYIFLVPLLPAYLWFRVRGAPLQRQAVVILAGMALFCFWPAAWLYRNAQAGCPMLSTTSGEVMRGSYNDVVFYETSWLGGWIQPEYIPGEEKFQALAKRMNQCDVCRYYQAEGKEYAKAHITRLPLVAVARFVRGYIPIPGSLSVLSLLGFGSRALLFAALVLTWRHWRKQISGNYQVMLVMFAAVSLVTSIAMVAASRHTFWLEVLLFPCAAAGVASWLFKPTAVPTHQ